jgi:hypothetical protein
MLGHSTRITIELGGTTAGSQYDQIHVTGQLTLDGALKVSHCRHSLADRSVILHSSTPRVP